MLLSERLEGVHPDRVLEILEDNVAAGHAARVRQALPRLLELHFSIRPELEALREALGEEDPAAAETVVEGVAAAFACGACGGALAAQAPDTRIVVCPYCGTENEVATRAVGHRWDAVLDPESPFHVGTFFERDGQRWQVIGMQHYRGRIREWDSKDSAWETSPAEYTVWWMLDGRRRIAYLGDDGRKRYWSEALVPDDPSVPAADSRAHEHGEWELVDVVGELSYRPRAGERLLTAERLSGGTGTSVERRLDAAGNPVEIGFYRESVMDDMAVLEGLGEAATLDRVAAWRRAARRFALAAAAVALGYLALRVALPDDPVFQARVPAIPVGAIAADGGGVPIGTFKIEGPFPPHRVRARAVEPLPENSSVSVELRLDSADAGVNAAFALELYHETGRDADGAWREVRYDDALALRLPAPAVYELFATDIDARGTAATPLVVSVEPNAFSAVPALLGALAALAGFLVCRMHASLMLGGAVSLAHVPRARGRDHRRTHELAPDLVRGSAQGRAAGSRTR